MSYNNAITPITREEALGEMFSITSIPENQGYLTREHFVESVFLRHEIELPSAHDVIGAANTFTRVASTIMKASLGYYNDSVVVKHDDRAFLGLLETWNKNSWTRRDALGLVPSNRILDRIEGIKDPQPGGKRYPRVSEVALDAGRLMIISEKIQSGKIIFWNIGKGTTEFLKPIFEYVSS